MVIRVTANRAAIVARLGMHNLEKASEEHSPSDYGMDRGSLNKASLRGGYLVHPTQLVFEEGCIEVIRVMQASLYFLIKLRTRMVEPILSNIEQRSPVTSKAPRVARRLIHVDAVKEGSSIYSFKHSESAQLGKVAMREIELSGRDEGWPGLVEITASLFGESNLVDVLVGPGIVLGKDSRFLSHREGTVCRGLNKPGAAGYMGRGTAGFTLQDLRLGLRDVKHSEEVSDGNGVARGARNSRLVESNQRWPSRILEDKGSTTKTGKSGPGVVVDLSFTSERRPRGVAKPDVSGENESRTAGSVAGQDTSRVRTDVASKSAKILKLWDARDIESTDFTIVDHLRWRVVLALVGHDNTRHIRDNMGDSEDPAVIDASTIDLAGGTRLHVQACDLHHILGHGHSAKREAMADRGGRGKRGLGLRLLLHLLYRGLASVSSLGLGNKRLNEKSDCGNCRDGGKESRSEKNRLAILPDFLDEGEGLVPLNRLGKRGFLHH